MDSVEDLQEAIQIAEQAVEMSSGDLSDLAAELTDLSELLMIHFTRTGQEAHLTAAISNIEMALAVASEDHSDRAVWLNRFGTMLFRRYELTGNMSDLQAAVSNAEIAVSAIPEDHPYRAGLLNNLGNMLSGRYKQTGNLDDLQAAISKAEIAVSITPEDHPDRARWLNNLGIRLSDRYKRTGNLDDLQAAISKAEIMVSVIPEGHPHRAAWLNNLGNMLTDRYEQTGNLEDLQAAISKAEMAVSVTPEHHPDRADLLNNLGIMLSDRYERTGNLDDLQVAISKAEIAVSAIPEGHSHRAGLFNNLGKVLFHRYERTGNMDDLKAAISKTEVAISATPEDHPDRARWLINFEAMLFRRYERTGNVDDLQAAISKAEVSVSTIQEDHPDRANLLSNLGGMLSRRYEQIGNLDDLQAAISKAKMAISATPEDHPHRAARITNLANMLSNRHERMGNSDDLQLAILIANMAISATPEDHPYRATLLTNLGTMLSYRYERTGNLDDIQAAILKAEMAVSATPEDHPDRARLLNNLGKILFHRYERTENMDDLAAAISKAEVAVSATPEDHPDRARWLSNLGTMLSSRYERTRNREDLNAALRCHEKAFECLNSVPVVRVKAARCALRIFQQCHEWHRAASLARRAVELLPVVCSRYLNREDQQHAILQTSGLAADACSLSLKLQRVGIALQQLEFGRGLILGYLIDSQSDLSELRKDCPDLADSYDILRFKASRVTDTQDPAIQEQMIKERREAARELEDCLHKIRQQPGCERFLLEPTVDELKSAAMEGPIVIVNSTDIGSDAIIVSTSEIRAVALPDMSTSKAPLWVQRAFRRYRAVEEYDKTRGRDMESETDGSNEYNVVFLSWLWSSCVKLVLEELDRSHVSAATDLPRIWWIGTGIASSLPFHAAGYHYKNSLENTLSRSIPSYTPTIKALTYSKLRAIKAAPLGRSKTSVLVVAMPETPGQRPLYGVDREKAAIQKALAGTYTIRLLEFPTAEQVLNDMRRFDIAHFACHGSSDPSDPSNSHLLLQKTDKLGLSVDKLTVSKISNEQTLGRAWITYLSACSTAEVKAVRFADEALHLTSAFQVAGFAHVIGSLWSADDDVCSRVAGHFYEYLTKHSDSDDSNRVVAEALREAVLQVRLDIAEDPIRRNKAQHSQTQRSDKVLLVSMETTDECSNLPCTKEEVDKLASQLPTGRSVLMTEPRKDDVLNALKSCSVFHFAGHGASHPEDPLKSALILADCKDNPLTVADLTDLKLHQNPPFLAYLSACSTGDSKVTKLIDEGMHLMGVYQLVGFRHVIGSLWELSDEYCVGIASSLYDEIIRSKMSDHSVSRGFHYAVRRLRDGVGGSLGAVASREAKFVDKEDEYDGEEEKEEIEWKLEIDDPRLWAAYIYGSLELFDAVFINVLEAGKVRIDRDTSDVVIGDVPKAKQ